MCQYVDVLIDVPTQTLKNTLNSSRPATNETLEVPVVMLKALRCHFVDVVIDVSVLLKLNSCMF